MLVIQGKGRWTPDFIAKMPIEGCRWMNVGRAFFNPKTESFTVYFDIIPDRCKVVLFKE